MNDFAHGVTLGIFLSLVIVAFLLLLACVWQKRREERAAWRDAMHESKQRHLARHVEEANASRVFKENL